MCYTLTLSNKDNVLQELFNGICSNSTLIVPELASLKSADEAITDALDTK